LKWWVNIIILNTWKHIFAIAEGNHQSKHKWPYQDKEKEQTGCVKDSAGAV
jgi:hypothetical protein